MSKPVASAQPPKQQRSRVRVAAILASGIEVFTEKGYAAATMTEIAARSDTAIGSLYRFFPSKEILADALLLQYAHHAGQALQALQTRLLQQPGLDLADALLDYSLALQTERRVAIALLEEHSGRDARRAEFRQAMRTIMAKTLRLARPDLSLGRSRSMAVVILHVLRAVTDAAQQPTATRRAHLAEIRHLLTAYLATDTG